MELDQQHKFKREQKQPWTWKRKEVAGKENSSFTTDSRSRKASIGITVAFSNRNLNVYEVRPLKPETEAYSSVRGRKTWTPLTPLKPQMMASATNQRQQDDIICPNPQELQLQSTQIVEEVYANRKSPLHSTGFAARRETNFVKYERRGKKENLVGELCIERSHHVKFNFNPSSSQEKNRSNDKSSEIELRTKLRNALGSLNSSSPEKQPAQAAAPQNEPKSDTIETQWEDTQQIAKPVKSNVQQRGKRKPSPPLHAHIFSFDQDEVECQRKPTKLSRMFTKTHPNTKAGLKLLLQNSPEKIIRQSSSDTEIQNRRSPSPAATAIRFPAEINTHPDTEAGLKLPLQTSPEKIIQQSSTDTEIQNHRSPSPATRVIGSPAEMPATTTFAESPSACLLARLRQRKGHMLVSNEMETVEPHKEASPLFIAREDVIRRSSARTYRNRIIETETKICRRRQVKRKSREQSPHKECAPHDEDGSDDSSGLMGVVKHFAGILQKFKKKLKMEVDRNKTQILNSASHDIHAEVDRIRSQIQSEIAKYTNLCKAKHRQWEAHLQDEKEKLELIHEKFNKDLAQLTQSWQTIFSQIEGEEIELKSIAERQKVSHRKLVSQMQETIESQLADAEAKITAVRKAAGNNMQALKRVMGQTF